MDARSSHLHTKTDLSSPQTVPNTTVAEWSATDPLVHYGRHFRRTIHALCNFQALLTNGILQMGELAGTPDKTSLEQCEHHIFQELLKSVAGLEEQLMQDGDDEVDLIAELASVMLTKGASGARGDNTKSLKGNMLDWITPKRQSLVPPLTCNVKIDHSFHYEWTGTLLYQWPLFLYADYHYDLEDLWNGLFQSALLAYKHIFTSPSSVDREPRATCLGNAQIHGMTRVTLPSIAYIAMQVYTVTNSEWFYNSILDIFKDPDEKQEVDNLVVWWNR
ncbi:hypothetical protein F4604DRAFT_1880564 [Suillus subluteus]|nr:hypothetical protein F4604DRAFT_1880564 [Suillus subluteus]